MMKSKLMKAALLGICLSAFSVGVAFAQQKVDTGAGTTAFEGEAVSPELQALYDKQAEIDRYLFTEHAKELEEKGIFVNYTGVNKDVIEIGISPYSDENADYLYDIFGKDVIKVVEFDQSVIFQSGVAVDPAVPAAEPGSTAPDTPSKDTDVQIISEPIDPAEYSEDDQIFYTMDVEEDDQIFYTTDAEAEIARDVKTVSAAETAGTGDNVSDEASEGLQTPFIILIIAAGAAVIGGIILVSAKKKNA